MKKRKKILFAAVDIGWRIEHYTKFINKNFADQLEAESFSKYVLPESQYKTKYTFTCPIDKTHPILLYLYSFCFFIYSLFRYDIFHFFSGETILTRKLRSFELAAYKLFGKQIIMHFVGSDIRSEEYISWKEKNIKQFLRGNNNFPKSLPWQKKLIQDAEKYADSILVSTPDLKELIPKSVYYPVLLDLNKFISEGKPDFSQKKKSDEIVILHCPSNTLLKGTSHIHDVLRKLTTSSNYKIKLLLPAEKIIGKQKQYAVSRYELFKLYKEADIVIDQLIIGWYGLQSIEALAMGKEVISYVDKHLEENLFPNCPIEIANVDNLEQVIIKCIKKILSNKQNDSTEVIDWIKKYHTIENNNEPLLSSWLKNRH